MSRGWTKLFNTRSRESRKACAKRGRGIAARSLCLESLEERRLLAIALDVTTTADSGVGSLREAIASANAATGPVTIQFRIPTTDSNFVDVDASLPGGDADPDVFVIRPLSALPELNNVNATIAIDGRSQGAWPGGPGDTNPRGPEIVLDGSLAGAGVNGLLLSSPGNSIAGLNIQRFGYAGIWIASSDNRVQGNYIGTDATGLAALGNAWNGVGIWEGANNVIGGNEPGAGNVIAGNSGNGIDIYGSPAQGNQILGNYIGTKTDGTEALGNGGSGITVSGASNNLIGGTTPGAGNVISGNAAEGIHVFGEDIPEYQWPATAGGNGHYYVVAPPETWTRLEERAQQLGGHLASVTSQAEQDFIDDTVLNDSSGFPREVFFVGGRRVNDDAPWTWSTGEEFSYTNWTAGEPSPYQNYVTVNWPYAGEWGDRRKGAWDNEWDLRMRGIMEFTSLPDPGTLKSALATRENVIQGNRIGASADGMAAIGNGQGGVLIENSADNTVGGTDVGARNVISGNAWDGIRITGPFATGIATATFAPPAALAFSSITLNKNAGLKQRSYIRTIDVALNRPVDGAETVTVALSWLGLDGKAAPVPVTLPSTAIAAGESKYTVDFGKLGITNNLTLAAGRPANAATLPNSPYGDGYYGFQVLLNGDVLKDAHFFRLLADATGDGKVDASDYNVVYANRNKQSAWPALLGADVNGSGVVDTIDVTLASQRKAAGAKVVVPPPWTTNDTLAVTGGGAGSTSSALAASPLAASKAAPLVDEAIRRWAAAGLDPAGLDVLKRQSISIATLPSGEVGRYGDGVIYLDATAAGRGWFVDPTPRKDEEFAAVNSNGQKLATAKAARGRVDLLTVLEHELGHALGVGHNSAAPADGDLMAPSLAVGVRKAVSRYDVAQARSGGAGVAAAITLDGRAADSVLAALAALASENPSRECDDPME